MSNPCETCVRETIKHMTKVPSTLLKGRPGSLFLERRSALLLQVDFVQSSPDHIRDCRFTSHLFLAFSCLLCVRLNSQATFTWVMKPPTCPAMFDLLSSSPRYSSCAAPSQAQDAPPQCCRQHHSGAGRLVLLHVWERQLAQQEAVHEVSRSYAGRPELLVLKRTNLQLPVILRPYVAIQCVK